VILLLGLSLFAHTIIDTDLWWHLRTGQYIVETGEIPHADMYSYTAGGNEWIDTHWLFQVILFGTHNALGAYGLSILFILIYCSVFALLRAACGRAKATLAALLFFWLGLMAADSRFLVRPEAFTYLMISVFTLVLFSFERGRIPRRAVFALIPLQALWANLQGLFILGPFLIAAYASKPIIAELINRVRKRERGTEEFQKAATLVILFACSAAVCMLNPYGLKGLLFPFTLFTRAGGMQNVFASSIAELQPPFSGYNLTLPLKYFAVFFTLCAGVLALDFRNLKLSHVLVFAGTGYLALSARRNVAIFVLAMLPIAVEHAGGLIARLREARGGKYAVALDRAGIACGAAIVAVVVLQIFSIVGGRHYIADKRAERFGFGFKEQTFPHGAFVFIKENDISGPFFNNMDIGGMFLWEMYPEEKVFIDARLEVKEMYPEEKVFIDARLEVNSAEIFSEYRRAMSDAGAFIRLSDKYEFNAAVVSHTSQDGLYLMPVLSLLPEWALVYFDPIAAVFVRDVGGNAALIGRHGIDIARDPIEPLAPHDTLNRGGPPPLGKMLEKVSAASDAEAQNRFNLGLALLVMGRPDRAIEQLEAGLDLMPSSPQGHYNLGLAHERMGRMGNAAAHYESAIRLDPRHAGAHTNLGRIYDAQGLKEMGNAAAHYESAIRLDPRHAGAHTNLGRIYDAQGLKEKAEAEYKRAVRWGGNDPVPLYNLGALYYERGDREAARKHWLRALKANPSFAPAKEALRSLDRPAH